jgi:hypothetical protein
MVGPVAVVGLAISVQLVPRVLLGETAYLLPLVVGQAALAFMRQESI